MGRAWRFEFIGASDPELVVDEDVFHPDVQIGDGRAAEFLLVNFGECGFGGSDVTAGKHRASLFFFQLKVVEDLDVLYCLLCELRAAADLKIRDN